MIEQAITGSERGAWRWIRASAIGISLLTILFFVWAWSFNFSQVNVTDYLSYWAAGKLVLTGQPADAYNVEIHRAVEFTVTSLNAVLPFPYPPPFLIPVTPFSLLPYMWGFAAWLIVTGIVYFFAARRVAPGAYAFAQPPAIINGWIGQNGFLTSAIFVTGTRLLEMRPFAGGAILGILVIKPQLAPLLPVAVIAARLWPAVAGAASSAAALLFLSLLLFGWEAYVGFWNILPLYADMMRRDAWPWNEFISVFAFLRWFGIGQAVASMVHVLVAVAATALTWLAWSRSWDCKVAVLAAATLLIAPYLLMYDALLLIVPMGFWIAEKRRPVLIVFLWFVCLLPVTHYFNLYRGPNPIPLVAILMLGLLVAERGNPVRAVAADMDHAHAV